MSMFFAAANTNHALILETFGVPTIACKEKLYMPTPCCQGFKSFKVSNQDLTFDTSHFLTNEGEKISVACSITYSVDTSSRSNIMKAYKSFHHSKGQNLFRSPFKPYEGKELDIEDGIKDVISTVVKKRMNEMPLEKMTAIDLRFVDSIHQEAKENLQASKVDLTSFKINEFVMYSDPVTSDEEEETAGKKQEAQEEVLEAEEERVVCSENFVENDSGAEGDDEDDVYEREASVTSDYLITIIPEDNTFREKRLLTTTSEVVIDVDAQADAQIEMTVETNEPIDHIEGEEVLDVPDLDVPDVPDLDVPDVPDLDVPDVPDLDVPDVPDLDVPDVPDLDVPDVPDIFEDAEGGVHLNYHIDVNAGDSTEHHATSTEVIMNEYKEESTSNAVVSVKVNLNYEID